MNNKFAKIFFNQNSKIFFAKHKGLILNFIFFFSTILAFFLFIFSIVYNQHKETRDKRFNIVLNFKNSYADRGYSQQSVEGVCESFNIKIPPFGKEKCDGTNQYFKDQTISYGYPGTMENPLIIEKYINNFSNIDNFVMAGFTYNTFLNDKKVEITKDWKDINFLTIDTNFVAKQNWPSNLYQIEIKQFLAGYHAALYSGYYALKYPEKFLDFDLEKDGKQIAFGSLGGLLILPIINYALGFKLGLQVINKNRALLELGLENEVKFQKYQTIGGFDPSQWSEKTKEFTKEMYKERISVVFSISTSLTKVMNLAAQEMDKKQKNNKHWIVGVDVDQGSVILKENPFKMNDEHHLNGKILISAILNIRKMISEVIIDKRLKSGNKIDATKPIIFDNVNLGEDVITIPKRFRENNLWKQLVTKIDDNKIINLSPEKLKKLEKFAAQISASKCGSQDQCDREIDKVELVI